MEKRDAIRELRKRSRDILRGSFAIQIAEAFGLSAEDIPRRNWSVQDGLARGATIFSEGNGISSFELATVIASKTTNEFVLSGPYLGRGKNAEYVTLENCKLIEATI